jgi:4-hydroxy-tetrahydrodipicolinate synthase
MTMTTTDTTTTPMLQGAFTALVTPFTPAGELDERAFRGLLIRQLEAGIDGLVPCGTTGESPTLSEEERDRLIDLTIGTVRAHDAAGRTLVVAGTGTNDTRATIAATRRAAILGADAALVVAPYYNKPDQRMLEAHYRAVADEGDLPVVVYNVPGRTGTNVAADTLMRLAEHPRIVAVKEASANLEQIMTILRDRPEGFAVLSGDDSWTLPVLGLGGDGVISVASNQVPATMVELCRAAREGDWTAARDIHERYLDLFRANFISPNPVPVKAALAELGLISDVLRQPLLPLDDGQRARVRQAMTAVGLTAMAGITRTGTSTPTTGRTTATTGTTTPTTRTARTPTSSTTGAGAGVGATA